MTENFTQLATTALELYGLETLHLTRLGGVDNTNFRVQSGGKSYVLHLYTSARRDRAAIASELTWLTSLRRDTSLEVPEPVANRAGELVTGVITEGIETLCTLSVWLEGKIPPTIDAMTPEQLEQTGALMAHLHAHARELEPSEGFRRPTFDETYFQEGLSRLYDVLQRTELAGDDLARFRADAETVLAYLGSLAWTKTHFGLIHGDFHSGNYLLGEGEVKIIDFGRCGFGFYLYDLALALMELVEVQRLSFLQGYRTVAPLPAGYTDLGETFLALAYLDNLSTLAKNPEETPFIMANMPLVLEAFEHAVENHT